MGERLHIVQPNVKPLLARWYNDAALGSWDELHMHATRIHKDKSPRHKHYLAEWMELRGAKPADVVEATGADKGLVSRWLNKGVLPGREYLSALAAFLGADDPNGPAAPP